MRPLRDGDVAPAERGGQSAFRQQHARVHLDARPAALHQGIDEKVPRLPFGEYRLGDQVIVQRREIADLRHAQDAVDVRVQHGLLVLEVRLRERVAAEREARVVEEDVDASELPDKHVKITHDYVKERLAEIVKDEDLSKFIL